MPGNTGFYYASIRKVKLLSVLWDAVLKAGPWRCFKAAGELGVVLRSASLPGMPLET
jgi:hypothetical protein